MMLKPWPDFDFDGGFFLSRVFPFRQLIGRWENKRCRIIFSAPKLLTEKLLVRRSFSTLARGLGVVSSIGRVAQRSYSVVYSRQIILVIMQCSKLVRL
jgi:hypothetical protein